MSSEASLFKPLRNPNTHWPQRSLFGSNIDASQALMSNISYKDFLNGNWKKVKHDNAKKTKSAHISESPALAELRSQIQEQKTKLKQKEVKLVESKEKALNFNTNVTDSSVPVINTMRSLKSPKPTGIRTFQNALPLDQVEYQYMGSVLDIGRYRNSNKRSDSKTESVKSEGKLADFQSELKDYNAIQMKHMNAYYPTKEQVMEAFRASTNNDRAKSSVSSKSSMSIDELPQNVKHRFRARQAQELMQDQRKVSETLVQMQNIEEAKKHRITATDDIKVEPPAVVPTVSANRPPSASIDAKQNAAYYDISNYLRHTVCHGYPDDKKRSLFKHVHNEYVSKEYLSDPANYQMANRRRKDWLAAWIASNSQEEGIAQAMLEYNASQKQKQPGGFKLPAIQKAKSEPAVNQIAKTVVNDRSKKSTLKNIRKKRSKNGESFPDFQFEDVPEETQEDVQKVRMNNAEQKKDDDFWNFYNEK